MQIATKVQMLLAALACACALSACGAGAAEQTVASEPQELTATINSEVPLPANSGRRADERLVFAGQPTQEELAAFGAAGYSVLDLRRPSEERGFDEVAFAAERSIDYRNIAVDRPALEDPDTHADFATAMREAESEGRPLLVHCASGQRVAGLYAVYLIEQKGVDRAAALQRAAELGLSSRGVLTGVNAYLDR